VLEFPAPAVLRAAATGYLLCTDPTDYLHWSLLVYRSHHSRSPVAAGMPLQVAHAEGAGAVAAVVYDDVYEPLILMAKVRTGELGAMRRHDPPPACQWHAARW
jgi:hypothetical protein